MLVQHPGDRYIVEHFLWYWRFLKTAALQMKMYLKLMMMKNLILCGIYESDYLNVELKHENDAASSHDWSFKWESGQDTVQVAVPKEVRTDEVASYKYLPRQCCKHASSSPGQISNLGSQKMAQVLHSPGKLWPSTVAMAGEKERADGCSKNLWFVQKQSCFSSGNPTKMLEMLHLPIHAQLQSSGVEHTRLVLIAIRIIYQQLKGWLTVGFSYANIKAISSDLLRTKML